MRNITRANGGTIIYDYTDWKAGLAPQGAFTTTTTGLRSVGVNGFSRIVTIDPFFKNGVLSPGRGPSSNSANSSQQAGVVVSGDFLDNSTMMCLDAGGKINKNTTSGTAPSFNTAPFPYTIVGTSPIGQDSILYKHNSGGATTQVTSWFYSYYNNTNWDVGAYVNFSGTPDHDFMSTVPTTPLDVTTGDGDDTYQRTMAHTMEVGADDILYIGSGRYLHAYDGATGSNGTFSSKVLTLPAGFQIVGLRKYQDILLIVGNYYSTSSLSDTGVALMYTWNYRDLDTTNVIPLEDSLVSSIFLWKGSPVVITSGPYARNGRNKVKIISGNTVTKIADFDGVLPTQRGVVTESDIIYLNCGGYINTVGDRFTKNSYAINQIAAFSNVGTSGVLIYNALQSCLLGASSDGTHAFENINNTPGAGSCRTPLFTPDFPLDKMGRIRSVTIEYYQPIAASGTNGNITVALQVDSVTQAPLVSSLSSVVSPLLKKYSIPTSGVFPQFVGVEILINWNASTGGDSPSISKIMIDYELVDIGV